MAKENTYIVGKVDGHQNKGNSIIINIHKAMDYYFKNRLS